MLNQLYANKNVKTVTCSNGAQTQASYRTGGDNKVSVDTTKNIAATIDTTATDGLIHFDTPSGFAFVVTVQKNSLKKYFVFDTTNLNLTTTSTIPGKLASYDETTGITITDTALPSSTLKITSFKEESTFKQGATGYAGNIAFTINPNDILSGWNAAEGDGKTSTWNILSAGFISNMKPGATIGTNLLITYNQHTYFWRN